MCSALEAAASPLLVELLEAPGSMRRWCAVRLEETAGLRGGSPEQCHGSSPETQLPWRRHLGDWALRSQAPS